MENGTIFRAKMFIDATYEGDLMAKAGVAYHIGREITPPTAKPSTASAPRPRTTNSALPSIPT